MKLDELSRLSGQVGTGDRPRKAERMRQMLAGRGMQWREMYQELEKRNLRQLRRELVSNKKEGNKTIYQNAVCKSSLF